MKDMLGQEIVKGCMIAYPGRLRSDLFTIVGMVVAVPDEKRKCFRIQVYSCSSPVGPKKYAMASNFRSPERCVVVRAAK